MIYNLEYSRYNASSILIEWKPVIDKDILQDVLRFKFLIKHKYIKEKVEVIHTYSSILIIYNFTIDNFNAKVLILKSLYFKQIQSQYTKSSLWKIPVCYDAEFGADLDEFSNLKNRSKAEVIELHTQPIYTVFFIGFLPGFLYLGGLNAKLHLDRKITPNLNVKKGAVGIGGNQTGIYPQNSPGGWHIIGNSPIELFNVTSNPPCFIKAGDEIQFHSISVAEHHAISTRIAATEFDLKTLKV